VSITAWSQVLLAECDAKKFLQSIASQLFIYESCKTLPKPYKGDDNATKNEASWVRTE